MLLVYAVEVAVMPFAMMMVLLTGMLEDGGKEELITAALKHVGNMKKRAMHKLIIRDMLGNNSTAKAEPLKENHKKTGRQEKRKPGMIHGCCK